MVALVQLSWPLTYFFAGGAGVGVWPAALPGAHLRSIAARIDDDVGARAIELHRLARDVDADRAAEAVRVPLEHVALRIAPRDEARFVGLVALLAAAAVARHVLQDLGMLRGEVVGRADDVHRPHRREADGRQRRRRHAHARRAAALARRRVLASRVLAPAVAWRRRSRLASAATEQTVVIRPRPCQSE